jgi:hypothetical protein
MKRIHLYDLHKPGDILEKTGLLVSPPELARQPAGLTKESFKDTEKHLTSHTGSWHVEVTWQNTVIGDFGIQVYAVGPHGAWHDPAKVYLILE